MTEHNTANEIIHVFECRSCGDRIGDGEIKNVVFMCDELHNADKAWCGKCFKNTPCGYGKHGEGCPTMIVCVPVQS